MSMLSAFFLADGADVPTYNGGDGFAPEDHCEIKSITPLEAGGMLAVLRGGGDSVELMDEFRLLTEQDAEEWTMSVPDDMVAALSQLTDEQMGATAEQFADATQEELGWSAADFAPVVADLRRLARRATATGKRMYLWNCL